MSDEKKSSTLSEKIQRASDISACEDDDEYNDVVKCEDLKEKIKRIKERVCSESLETTTRIKYRRVWQIIDEEICKELFE